MQLTDAGTSFRMRRAVLCAVLWCVIVSITETINQPLTGITLHEQVSFLALVASSYMTCGLIWAVGAELPASRRRPLLAFALQLVAATAADVASNELVPLFMSHSSSMASILFTAPFPDFIGHAFWGNAFFGGLFVAAHRFTQQNLELHRRLARLRLVLGESEMRLREARVQSLQEQLRPATLVQALHAMRASYIRDPATGDRLFDTLIAFLRLAMPGRTGRPQPGPTTAALIEGYAALRNAIDPAAARWHVMCDAASAMEAPAPRRLLAVLDQIEAAIPEGRTIEVWASGSTVGHVIRLRVKSEPGNADLGRLIEVLKEFDVGAQALTEPDTWLEVALPLSRAPDPATPPQPDYRRQYQGEHHAEHLA